MMRNIIQALFTLALTAEGVSTEAKRGSIQTIINLLNKMITDNKKSVRTTEETCESQACWYKTFKKNKESEIKTLEDVIQQSRETLNTQKGSGGKNKAEAANFKQDLSDSKHQLQEKTAEEKERLAEFNAEETKLNTAIEAMNSALIVLSGKQGLNSLTEVKTAMRKIQQSFPDKHFDSQLVSLLQQEAPVSDNSQSYAKQSDGIVGYLQQMQSEFQEDLESEQKDNTNALSIFNGLEQSLNKQIDQLEADMLKRQQNAANAGQSAAEAKQVLDESTVSLTKANDALLKAVKDEQTDAQSCTVQKKELAEEGDALKVTLGVLDSDKANSNFNSQTKGGSLNNRVTLLQKGSSLLQVDDKKKSHLSLSALRKQVGDKKFKSLLALAGKNQQGEDFFAIIQSEIANMIQDMKKSQEEDTAMVESCKASKQSLGLEQDDLADDKRVADDEKTALEGDIVKDNKNIKDTKDTIAQNKDTQKKASETRQKRSQEYQEVHGNNVEVMALLDEAKTVLRDFMNKRSARKSLLSVATMASDDQNAKPQLAAPKKTDFNSEKGPMGLIRKLQNQVDMDMKNNKRVETDREEAYVANTKEFQVELAANLKSLNGFQGSKATHEEELNNNQQLLRGLNRDIRKNNNNRAVMESDCADMFNNYDSRKANRLQEMEDLQKASQELKGAKFD